MDLVKELSITPQEDSVHVRFTRGTTITPEMIIRAIDLENELHPGLERYDLWDFRGCSPSDDFGYDAMRRIIDHVAPDYSEEWESKTAILVDETTQFGMSRMFQTLIETSPTHIEIFQDESRALQWLDDRVCLNGSK